MSRLKGCRPSAPVVINLIALSIVLGGHAVALPGKSIVRKGDIAAGAVSARNLAPHIVSTAKLHRHAVHAGALADAAVVGRVIAPNSVSGLKLGPVDLGGTASAAIPDSDLDPGCCAWTASAPVSVPCPPGALLLSGGVTIEGSSTQRTFIQTSAPSSNAPASNWIGQISADDGGTATARVRAWCLL
jgi:hypothetical protein